MHKQSEKTSTSIENGNSSWGIIPERKNLREHIAFGQGIHVCVGAGLARIEAAATLQALAAHVTAIEVVDRDALRYGPSFVLRGLETLPVRVRRR